MALEFCDQSVGVALLHLVSRAQALIAELLRLSDRVPDELQLPGSIYAPLFFDFRYFKSPEIFEERIESNPDLSALDDDFRDKYTSLLERFFLLFNGIVNYYLDLGQYLEDLQEGVYIQSTVESVLHNEDGCQLLVESMVLHGVILMLLEHRLDGNLREHLLVSYFRCKGTFDVPNFDSLCTLCRHYPQPASSPMAAVTSLLQGAPLPVPATMLMLDKTEEVFSRFPLPSALVQSVIGRLRTHDLYSQVRHYPSPDHRTTALLVQAASLYVLLYFVPAILRSDPVVMREVVDKFFKGFWVVPIHMGFTVDLLSAWNRFKAAKYALNSMITPSVVRGITEDHIAKANALLSELGGLLSDGVLSEEYVMNNTPTLVSCVRNCNVSLRWLLLHRITTGRKFRELVSASETVLLTLLLDTSRLEFELKSAYGELLNKKETRWVQSKKLAAECMQDLCDFFSGAKVLARTVRDESLQQWFSQMASQVDSLDYSEAVSAGRKIQHMITALEEVEQFHQIEASIQTKQYLSEARAQLQEMVRTLNVQETTLATISVVSDCSYAWGVIGDFTSIIHSQIQKDPFTVSKLQCLFLKLRSVMDIPLLRISQCQSPDFESVSEYYSSELVMYVRKVLEIVPVSMFSILNGIIKKETKILSDMPARLEKDALRDHAKLNERYSLAKATQRVAVFTQGIMSMKRTFIGVIELDPRQLLEDGIRKQLAEEIHFALDKSLMFPSGRVEELEEKLEELSKSLQSQRQSMEYFQDYVHVHGLRLWQDEYRRTVNSNTEQECVCLLNKFANKKQGIQKQKSDSNRETVKTSNFMGRLMSKLFSLTHPSKSMYLAPLSGWFNAEGQELVGLRTFILLLESIGPVGLAGLEALICFDAASTLQKCITNLASEMHAKLLDQLEALEAALGPPPTAPIAGMEVYTECLARIAGLPICSSWVEDLAHIGQLQLIRCLLTSQLRATAQLESGLIFFTLEGINTALISSISEVCRTDKSGILSDLRRQLQACGMCSPMKTIYVTAKAPDYLSLLLFLITITQLTRYVVDKHLGTLASKTKKSALDCCPLVVGFATLLQQFHPSHTISYIQLLGQYAQTQVESNSNKTSTQWEAVNTVAWILEYAKHAGLPHDVLEASLPPLILESFAR